MPTTNSPTHASTASAAATATGNNRQQQAASSRALDSPFQACTLCRHVGAARDSCRARGIVAIQHIAVEHSIQKLPRKLQAYMGPQFWQLLQAAAGSSKPQQVAAIPATRRCW